MQSQKDKEAIDAMTAIFLRAFDDAAAKSGVPVDQVANQFVDEMTNRANKNKKAEKLASN